MHVPLPDFSRLTSAHRAGSQKASPIQSPERDFNTPTPRGDSVCFRVVTRTMRVRTVTEIQNAATGEFSVKPPPSCGSRTNAILRGCGVASQMEITSRPDLRKPDDLSRVAPSSHLHGQSGAPRAIELAPARMPPPSLPSLQVLQVHVPGVSPLEKKPGNADRIAPTSAVSSPTTPPQRHTEISDDGIGVEFRQTSVESRARNPQ